MDTKNREKGIVRCAGTHVAVRHGGRGGDGPASKGSADDEEVVVGVDPLCGDLDTSIICERSGHRRGQGEEDLVGAAAAVESLTAVELVSLGDHGAGSSRARGGAGSTHEGCGQGV